MRLLSYDAVIIDSDGTAFDSENICLDAYEIVAKERGLPATRKDFLPLIGMDGATFRSRITALYGDDALVDSLWSRAEAVVDELFSRQLLVPEKQGFSELLQFLRAHDRKVGLGTSASESWVKRVAANRLELFDTFVCRSEGIRGKPSPDIPLEVCRRLKSTPERTIAIEDSEPGIRAHHAAGVRCIVVLDHAHISEEGLGLAEAVLPSLHDVKRYLEQA